MKVHITDITVKTQKYRSYFIPGTVHGATARNTTHVALPRRTDGGQCMWVGTRGTCNHAPIVSVFVVLLKGRWKERTSRRMRQSQLIIGRLLLAALYVVSWWPAKEMTHITYMVRRTPVHTVTATMQHHRGYFWTSNKIWVVANELWMLKNEFNIPTFNDNFSHCNLGKKAAERLNHSGF